MTLRELLRSGEEYLKEHDVADASVDAWLLLEHVTGLSRAEYLAHATEPLEKVCAILRMAADSGMQAQDCSSDEGKPKMKFVSAEDALQRYRELLKRRSLHIPLQHLTGEQEFMGLSFLVNEHVLVPRQDTETLVEEALKRLRPGMRILDLCTGSGCIAVSLAKLGPEYIARQNVSCTDDSKPVNKSVSELWDNGESAVEKRKVCVDASDISPEALAVARENAQRLGAQVRFIESDLFAGIARMFGTSGTDEFDGEIKADRFAGTGKSDRIVEANRVIGADGIAGRYDMIVSNPPYVRTAVIGELAEEVRLHEPTLALDGAEDGLHFYREIVRQSLMYLTDGGQLLFEIGYDQAEAVRALMAEAGFTEIEVIRDLAGHDRVVTGKWSGCR